MSFADKLKNLNEIDLSQIDINDIDFERRGSWPLAGQIFFYILLVVAALAAAYFLSIEKLDQRLVSAENEELQLKQEFSRKAMKAASLDAYTEQMEQMNETFDSLLRQLPRDTNVPGLIDDIEDIARQSGIKVKKTEIRPEKQTEFYVELPFTVIVEGGYHEFGGFVSGIAALPRIVTLHDYNIKPEKNGKLVMTIEAKTYKYSDQEGV